MSWQLFDRIRAFARSVGVYQQERIFQDQPSLDKLMVGGKFIDFSHQQALQNQTTLQINRLERLKDYDQMDEVGEMSLSLDLYADESSLTDSEYKHVIIIKAKSVRVKERLEDLFFRRLLIDNYARPAIRYLCKYGDCPAEIVPAKDRKGVSALRYLNIYNFTRVETKYGDLIGFFYQDDLMEEPLFLHPWQIMHLRLTSLENLFHPSGKSILEGGRRAFKVLRLLEDAAVIYRITRAYQKRVFKIPVGNIPTKEIPEYLESIARQFKQQRFYDPRTGTFNERYAPLIAEDDYWLPERPDGHGPTVENLEGAENLDKIADIEYFKKKMVAPMKIPFARVGIGEGAGQPNDKSLASTHNEFAKAVQWVQREYAMGLMKVAFCDLMMGGFTGEELTGFTISMSATSAIDELYRMETWGARTNVMADLKDLEWFPKEWIVARFTDLSPDEIQSMEELMAKEAPPVDEMAMGGGGGGGGGRMPGGLDIPGLGGPEGGPEGAPSGPEGGEGGPENAENPEAPEVPAENEVPLPELKLNTDRIGRVIMEDRKQKKLDILRRIKEDKNQIFSPFTKMVESGELDGIKNGEKVLVESSLTTDEAEVIKKEYLSYLMPAKSESTLLNG